MSKKHTPVADPRSNDRIPKRSGADIVSPPRDATRHAAIDELIQATGAKDSSSVAAEPAADPLNLVGIVVPGDRVAANSGRTVAFRDGKAVPPSEHPDIAVLAAG